jgi:hypothetical protein
LKRKAADASLYAQLLPGITNVTDRARYFSFYPWLIWAIEQHGGPLRRKPLYQIVRRADVLYTLIAARHQQAGGGVKQDHGALIGANTIFPELSRSGEGAALRLSEFATTEADPTRYFQNRLGGLGQYYLGTLRDADILTGDLRSGVRYTPGRGLTLARAFNEGVNRGLFFEVMESDRVATEELDSLSPFCACRLHENPPEQEALVNLFFSRDGDFHEEAGSTRRRTLALALDLCRRLQGSRLRLVVDWAGTDLFRACVYGGALPGSEPWETGRPSLEAVRLGWQYYHRYELFSIATQALFWAGLDELREQGVRLADNAAYGEWFVENFGDTLDGGGGETFGAAVRRTTGALPPLRSWEDASHEVQLGWLIRDAARAKDASSRRAEVVRAAVRLLLALAARGGCSGFEDVCELPAGYLRYYQVNLQSFEQHADGDWRDVTMRELLGFIAVRWGVDTHLRVALRKLRGEARDTFKIKPTDQGLEVTDAPPPSFTNPRLKQALQILYDLKAVELDARSDAAVPTALGRRLLEEVRGD